MVLRCLLVCRKDGRLGPGQGFVPPEPLFLRGGAGEGLAHARGGQDPAWETAGRADLGRREGEGPSPSPGGCCAGCQGACRVAGGRGAHAD